MLADLKVKVGPQFYVYDKGAIDRYVPQLLHEYRAQKVLIVHGKVSWEKAKPYLGFVICMIDVI